MWNFILLFVSTATAMAANCTDEEITKLKNYERMAITTAEGWLQKIDEYEVRYPAETRSLEFSREKINCFLPKLKAGMNYSCVENVKYAGHTIPIFGNDVSMNRNMITSKKPPIAVIIHEASHKCGTSDALIFDDSEGGSGAPRSAWWTHWSQIAYTYSFWSNAGFCVPGIDCDQVLSEYKNRKNIQKTPPTALATEVDDPVVTVNRVTQ